MTLNRRLRRCLSVSPETAHRWWHRWLEAAAQLLGLSIAPRGLALSAATAERRSRRSRSCVPAADRQAAGPEPASRGSSGAPGRRSGRCSGEHGSRGGRAASGRCYRQLRHGRGATHSCSMNVKRRSPDIEVPVTSRPGDRHEARTDNRIVGYDHRPLRTTTTATARRRANCPDARRLKYTASRGSATRSRAGGRTRVAEMARLRSELANREVPSQATHRRASRAREKAPACRSTSPR